MVSAIKFRSWIGLASVLALVSFARAEQPQNRIVGPINEAQVVTLQGNVHPMARGEFDRGAVSGEMQLEQMVLELEPSAAQQAELNALLEAQHDPDSPLYQKWLTPQQYGARFGLSAGDLQEVTSWLQSHGFRIDEIPAGNRLVIFSGTAEQVEETFHPAMHLYQVGGAEHVANALDPQIPEALAGVVGGVVSLHDFRRQSQRTSREPLATVAPEYTNGSTNYLYPADWATIYDLNSLYSAGVTGKGTTIAIVGRSNINLSDVSQFRSKSGLPANQPTVVLVSTNPGLVSGDQDESTLDVEWSGATAPGATVKFVVGMSTATSDGVDLSAQYIVNHNSATVMSTSYGSCEQDMGSTELAFYNGLWQQAAAEGISAFVSSGDAGVAGCYSGSAATASGTGVNGLCSSPYSTCVGGTEFNEGSSSAKYWAATNNASTQESALSYIPEKVWNESSTVAGGSGLWSSGGGASLVYPQPVWQKNVAGTAAANGMRAVPDIAMSAAGHDGYIIVENGNMYTIAGTSAASPSFAGLMALLVQARGGTGQGNANPGLYALAAKSSGPFHPTPSGNNSVPGVAGFTASGGTYNLATGLGSVDGALLVSNWGSPLTTSSVDFAMSQSANSGTAAAGSTAQFTVSLTEGSGGKSIVALTAKAPTGMTVAISPASLAPGATATVTVSVASAVAAGVQTITITGTDGTGTQSVNYALTVSTPPTLTLTAGASTATLAQGATGSVGFTAVTGGTFAGNVTMSLSGLPSGVTATWSANPVTPASGSASATLTLAAGASAVAGTSTLTITASGDGLTATSKVTLQVTQGASFTLTASPSSASMQSLGSTTVTVTATPVGGAVVASGAAGSSIGVVSGLPTGVTVSWGSPSVNSSGAVTWTLTLTGSSTAAAETATLGLTAKIAPKTGSVVAATANLPLTVSLTAPTLTMVAASSALNVAQGAAVTDAMTLTANGTFSGAVTLSVSGLPSGVTASWSANGITLANGTGSSTLTVTSTSAAAVGSTTVTVTAIGDGLTATSKITLQVTQAANFTLTASPAPASMQSLGSTTVTVTATPVGGAVVASGAAGSSIGVTSGLPTGVTASWGSPTVNASGTVSWTLTLTGSSTASTGTATLALTAKIAPKTGSTVLASANLPLTVTAPPTMTLTAGANTVAVAQGASAPVSFAVATGGSFAGSVSLSVSGLPSGVTATWSANPVTPASGSASATLTLAAGASAVAGTTTLTVTATGDGLTATSKVALQVTQAAGFTLVAAPASASMQSGGSTTVSVTATSVGSVGAASGTSGSSISVASGLPKGVTASWSTPTVNSAGAVTWTLTLTGSATAVAGSATLGLTAQIAPKTGATVATSANLPLTVSQAAPTLSVAPASGSVSVVQAKTVTDAFTLTGNGAFSGAVTLSVTGLPSGVTASWSANGITLANGSGSSTLTLTASGSATVSSTQVTVTATGDGLTAKTTLTVNVQPPAGLTMGLSVASLSMAHTSSGQITINVTPVGGLKLTGIEVSVSGIPAGVTLAFGQGSLSNAGVFSAPMTLTGSSSAKTGNFSVNVTASTGINGSPSATDVYTTSQTLTLTLK